MPAAGRWHIVAAARLQLVIFSVTFDLFQVHTFLHAFFLHFFYVNAILCCFFINQM